MADWWVESFRDVSLTVPPMLGFSADPPSQLAGSTLTVPPELSVAASVHMERAVSLTIPPALAVAPEQHSSVGLLVPPAMGVAAAGIHMDRTVTLSVPPTIGVSGEVHYPVTVRNVAGTAADVYSAGGSFTITAAAGDYVTVDVNNSYSATAPATVTCGGTAMTLLGSWTQGGSVPAIYRYGLASVAAGTHTVTYSSLSGYSNAVGAALVGVGSVGATTGANGSNSTPSQSATCTAGQLILQTFGKTTGAFGSASGPSRILTSKGTYAALAMAASAASATFGDSSSATGWVGLATVFNPVT